MQRRRRGSDHKANQFRKTIRGFQCVYCGETTTCYDHFPPLSYSLDGVRLPSCSECNALAGTEYPINFTARIKHVQKRLCDRYQKYLKIPDLDTDDPRLVACENLKRWLIASIVAKRRAERRLAWNAVTYLAAIDHNSYFAAMLAETGDFFADVLKSTIDLKD